MKKILYFDHGDKGYRNFLRLDSKFKKKGYETLLLHTSSWLDKYTEQEKIIENLVLRDISYYKTFRLKKVIKKEKPSIIIMLNLSFITDRTLVKICKDIKINLFHLSHGMLMPRNRINVFKTTVIKNKNLLSRLHKKNIYCIYNYLIEFKSISKAIAFFTRAIKSPTEYSLFPKYSSELNVNKSFVYYPSDYNTMVNEFGFPKEKIEIVGNPELDDFYNQKSKNKKDFCINTLGVDPLEYIAYIDDGLSSVHNWDLRKWIHFIKDLNEIIIKQKKKLIIKLHPRRDISNCTSFFNENNIKYFYDIDFKNFIQHSFFVISHLSSVIIYALLLKKKTKSPRWGISKDIEEKYPEGVINYYYSKQGFKENFFDTDVDTPKINKYLLNFIGKVDGKSVDRIVNAIIKENI